MESHDPTGRAQPNPEVSAAEVAALTARLADGDPDALARLFSLDHERLHRMVHFRLDPRLRGRLDPDDILQEAYLAARQRIDSFAAERCSSVFVWLRLMVGQTMIDVHRRHIGSKMRDAKQEISLRFSAPMASSASMSRHFLATATSPSQAAMKAELAELLEKVIDEMEPIDREVLVLRHFEELTNKEVAELLGIQTSTASNRYVRALQRLKDILSRLDGSDDPSAGQAPR
ncbi:MAG: sigma-70 family RNA polymerase sigma factor [Planctomycetes bacterium]|nr:sigma-70 family RNA polymerase sigma factor [Planctomycetota bacterium]MCB9871769.1 sigma-70 family RNA polymerase sigma factor [Planctomycetota bacterium]